MYTTLACITTLNLIQALLISQIILDIVIFVQSLVAKSVLEILLNATRVKILKLFYWMGSVRVRQTISWTQMGFVGKSVLFNIAPVA